MGLNRIKIRIIDQDQGIHCSERLAPGLEKNKRRKPKNHGTNRNHSNKRLTTDDPRLYGACILTRIIAGNTDIIKSIFFSWLKQKKEWFWNIRRLSYDHINMIADDISVEVYLCLQAKCQDNALKLIRNPKKFIWNMVRNQMIDEDRWIGRWSAVMDQHHENREDLENSFSANFDENADEVYWKKQQSQMVKRVIKKLTPFEQFMICLRFKEDLSYSEIGEIINESQDYVGVFFFHLRRKLFDLMN